MKERIKQFMDYKGLSAAELADQIGVQRSNVSHVLTGRNNPSSSFLEKLLITFPELEARWLIVGEGQMIKDEAAESQNTGLPGLFAAPKARKEIIPKMAGETKEVDRIIILYKDRTFKDYYPEN